MVGPRLRPRFEFKVPFPVADTIARLVRQGEQTDCPFEGTIAGNHMHLNIRKADQKIWSPHLNLEVLPNAAGSLIKGHFGPRPDIWTLVMALYAICGFLALMAIMFALSQWMLNMPLWSLWIAGGAAGIGIIVYVLALIGQGLSQDQMHTLLSEVKEAVDIDAEVTS